MVQTLPPTLRLSFSYPLFLFFFFTKHLLHKLGQWFKLCLQLLDFLFLVLFFKVKAFLCCRLEFFPIELFQLLHSVLIDWVYHVQNFQAFFAEGLKEWR